MPCSAVTLSLATITSIIAVALLTIAFATDNWLYIEVKRTNIQNYLSKHSDAQSQALLESVNSKYYYYTRTKGLFRICYPKERPPTVKTYLSPVETHCNNINYYISDEDNDTRDFTDDAWTKLHMSRSMIALFVIAFLAIFSAFCTGVAGCWRRSPGNITATAILMLLACLLSAGAMGLWHGVEYYEKEKVVGEEFYQQWSNGVVYRRNNLFGMLGSVLDTLCIQELTKVMTPNWCSDRKGGNNKHILQDNTEISYDWSFILGWLGVFASCFSFFLFLFGSCCLNSEKRQEQLNNMQYIMPVYPQKQQYAYAGYPMAHQQFAGPYYTTGSAYGPYNY